MISIKGLNKFFNKGNQNEIHVINDVSLELAERGMVAIFGKSGCGKTTLLNVIGGLDSFASGEVTIEGRDIRKDTDDIRNSYIGYIFQNYNLSSSETCFENVATALRLCGITDEAEIDRRVMAALRNVGMENFKKRYPDTLSGGQQQRIAIARAIVKNPKIILADEPTGNLDETNTVMIMDLLRAISKEHLVILVTHEANLVDYYCDTVIELSDGKVLDVKHNSLTSGFVARDKNDIYLGELNKSELSDENALVEYYGEAPASPIKLKIINSGGKTYVHIETDKVHVLDETSEIRLREGVYEEKRGIENKEERALDMSLLSPVKATKTGKLFTFKSSIKSGYSANFLNGGKKGKAVLKRFMALFASVIVFISAMFGTAFRDILRADAAYNHNVFYLYTPDEKTSKAVIEALSDSEAAIDYVRLTRGYPNGDSFLSFRAGSFETFGQYDFTAVFGTNAVLMDSYLAKDLKLLEGKNDSLSESEMVITSRVADALIEKSTLGYIEEHKDLLGLSLISHFQNTKAIRIAGVVESDESAVYINELTMARFINSSSNVSFTAPASDYGITLNSGETVLAIRNGRANIEYPSQNEKIKIQGLDFTVVQKKEYHFSYDSWLSVNGIKKYDAYNYFSAIVKESNPTLAENSEEFKNELASVRNRELFNFYDYYYTEIKSFYQNQLFFEPYNFEMWLYVEKGIETAKYAFIPEEYYKACAFKEINGRYPTVSELELSSETLPSLYEDLKEYYSAYESEFYKNQQNTLSFVSDVYLVSDEDFITLSKQTGETHPSAEEGDKYYYRDEYYGDENEDDVIYSNSIYTVIHSNNPEKTENWLRAKFPDLKVSSNKRLPLITPSDVHAEIISSAASNVFGNLIAMAVIIAITSVCMYFIMHSSVMNRIKEIGIYRAIGVSRKNLIFRSFVEASLLTVTTVLVGYIVSSALLGMMTGGSLLTLEIFFYPPWLALAVLLLISSITLFFGTLPIILLLRKTPSRILAKYDI